MALTSSGTAASHVEAAGELAVPLAVVLDSLEDSKAEDIVAIDVTGKTPIADHMVVASGRSHRHVGAVAERLLRDLKDQGAKGVRVEGLASCDWVLIDTGDVVVHVFRPEVRTFYNLEKMWQMDSAAQVELVV
ncbi:ribosome silencing factor [Acuticoccus sp.]|uniref:ribosome silencing factor n=1 Tax=Acuticoccus sp. TaxID=1904378 RepID=UPI003B52C5F2